MQISVQNLTKSYIQSGGQNKEVLRSLNLEIQSGERIAVVGPSGSGKSTLLNLLGLMDSPDSGQIIVEGQEISAFSEKERRLYRNQKIGFVFQQHHLLPQCNLLENILLPTLPAKTPAKEAQAYAEELMKQLGIWELRAQKPSAVSVGEGQRAAIARALINKPLLILADEPSGALDSRNAMQLGELLSKLNKEMGLSLVVVTHSETFASLMDSVYTLTDGVLKKNSQNPAL